MTLRLEVEHETPDGFFVTHVRFMELEQLCDDKKGEFIAEVVRTMQEKLTGQPSLRVHSDG